MRSHLHIVAPIAAWERGVPPWARRAHERSGLNPTPQRVCPRRVSAASASDTAGSASQAITKARDLPEGQTYRGADVRGFGPPASLAPAHGSFSYYNKCVEIHDAARKHGVADEDIVHAIDNALATEDAGEDPDRWLLIGPDRAGNLLEVVVMILVEGSQVVIHAMPCATST